MHADPFRPGEPRMKIAAFIDRQGLPLALHEPGVLRLFAHEDGT